MDKHRTPHPPAGAGRAARRALRLLPALATMLVLGAAQAATPAELLAAYTAQGGTAPQATRGEAFFTAKHGQAWSCASCHGAVPTQDGRHATTGKAITPLAPAFNPQRFTDAAKADKWFRRNCNDVLGRACTEGEKADVLTWLLTLKTRG